MQLTIGSAGGAVGPHSGRPEARQGTPELGKRIAVYPMFEAFDVRPVLRIRPRPLRVPQFLADAHLGALANRLRILGFDTRWFNDLGDAALAELAEREKRILLTRDRGLLMRRNVTHGCYVRHASPSAQLAELVQRFELCAEIAPFSRCIVCNGALAAVALEAIRSAIPPLVWVSHREYWRCKLCERIYWKGSHWARMRQEIQDLCIDAREDA